MAARRPDECGRDARAAAWDRGRFVLFVAPSAPSALHNLEHGLHHSGLASDAVEVVDMFRESERPLEWRVFATPTLVRRSAPEERLYGDLA